MFDLLTVEYHIIGNQSLRNGLLFVSRYDVFLDVEISFNILEQSQEKNNLFQQTTTVKKETLRNSLAYFE